MNSRVNETPFGARKRGATHRREASRAVANRCQKNTRLPTGFPVDAESPLAASV